MTESVWPIMPPVRRANSAAPSRVISKVGPGCVSRRPAAASRRTACSISERMKMAWLMASPAPMISLSDAWPLQEATAAANHASDRVQRSSPGMQ